MRLAARRALNRRAIDRLMPLPPATVTELQPPAKPSQRALDEAWRDQVGVLEQRLTLALADLYQRDDIAVSGALEPNQRQELHPGRSDRMLTGNGMPAVAYMHSGPYARMAVSIAMARHLLARDGGGSAGP